MLLAQKKTAKLEKPRIVDTEKTVEQFDLTSRESAELVIALSGAVGSGMSQIVDPLKELLDAAGYETRHIKISKLIEKYGLERGYLIETDDLSKSSPDRYDLLQTAGNKLRQELGPGVLAELAISTISTLRTERLPPGTDLKANKPTKTAYIVDQLKNPAEVRLLRRVYDNLFFLIGVFASEKQRLTNLRDSMTKIQGQKAIDRDRAEEESHEQQLDKTLKLADLFLRNNHGNRESTTNQLERLLKLIHGAPALTPNKSEYAMYAAYSAGLRSACLSRQVGAAVTDKEGDLLATGCNDVPRSGGGLYSAEVGELDHRCHNWNDRRCWNDFHKTKLERGVSEILQSEEVAKIIREDAPGAAKQLSRKVADEIAQLIKDRTRLKDLIEFSRAVHAEMDAILTVARRGGPGLVDGQLFSTTFPCHNCARQIVAAGIKTVFYIEPYEKSLALSLHEDSIVQDPDENEEGSKVRFLHFEGISPLQYQRLFVSQIERKDEGKIRHWNWGSSRKSNPQYLDDYIELEARVMKDLQSRGISEDSLASIPQ